MTKKNTDSIILIGMPGCGKSTVGASLSQRLGLNFIDTDDIIEKNQGIPLQQIVDTYGYKHFRNIEEAELVNETFNNQVVATGGSVVYSHKLMESFKRQGTIIYLDITLEQVGKRISNDNPNRGIASPADQSLRDIYNERSGLYAQYADITVNNNGAPDIDGIIKKLNDQPRITLR
jgi:shikimate kinase